MNKFFTGCLCFFALSIPAQQIFECGQQLAIEKLFADDPSAKARIERLIVESDNYVAQKTSTASSFTIPIVFHVLHLGGSENISDAQIQDAVNILNRDFRKQNADTGFIINEFKALAADCNIDFRLATKDPDGNCTNGITRHYDSRANWTLNFADYVYTWPPSKYLNIYVVKSLPSGIGGYTYLPGTVGGNADAVVILNGMTGSIGTSNVFASRALTHEVGHWLNLQHVWGSTNNPGVACGDDGVGDTPVTKGHSNCNVNAAICTPTVKENVQNYMEYSFCTHMFTQGQRARMHNCINGGVAGRNNLSSASNLSLTGVTFSLSACAPIAEYRVGNSITCVGNPIQFYDLSYNGTVTSWVWTSPNAAGAYTVQNPGITFTAAGLTSVQLKAGNNSGVDSVNKQSVIVLAGATQSGNINVTQGFESVFPDAQWIKTIPKFGSAFEQSTVTAAGGTVSAWVNNYLDNPNVPVSIYSPAFNLANFFSGQLSFKYAYSQQNQQNNDRLRVYYSLDCGQNWNVMYNESSVNLSTTGSLITSAFFPNASQWKTENLSLAPVAGNSQVYFQFEFMPDPNGPGNNFFIDDININSVVGLNEHQVVSANISAFPNPFGQKFSLVSDRVMDEIVIYDVSGREIHRQAPQTKNAEMDLSVLSSGIYFAAVRTDKQRRTLKLIKN